MMHPYIRPCMAQVIYARVRERNNRVFVMEVNYKMLERDVEKKLVREIRKIGGLCLKLVCPGFTGVPDRMIILPGGRIVFAELKRPGKAERPRQVYVQALFREMGLDVISTVDSYDAVRAVVAHCSDLLNGVKA